MRQEKMMQRIRTALVPGIPAGLDICDIEHEGQQLILGNGMLPIELDDCTEDSVRALGFQLGEPIPNDPLFRYGSIPIGWTMRAEGSLHTALIDEKGNHRGYISYKAAPYDRWARLSVQ